MTDETILKTGDNSVKFTMDIFNMDKKMKNFQHGRKINSKSFVIGRSTFCIEVFPGHQSIKKNKFVGIYIRNKSTWRVKVNGIISVPQTDITRKTDAYYFEPAKKEKSHWGFSDLIPHHRCRKDELLSKVGTLTVQVDLELLGEEVLPSTVQMQENVDRFEKLENIVIGIGEDIQDIECLSAQQKSNILCMQESIKRIETHSARQTAIIQSMIESQAAIVQSMKVETALIQRMEAQSATETNELRKMIKDLSIHVSTLSKQSVEVECPVCMEVARPPMRLKQCDQGHIVCDTCQSRAEACASGVGRNPNMALCHTCREVITGRPLALERVLGLS